MMDFQKSKRFLIKVALVFFALALLIYLAAGEQFHWTYRASNAPSADSTIGEISDGMVVTQRVRIEAESITGISLMMSAYGNGSTGSLHVTFQDAQGQPLAEETLPLAEMTDGTYFDFIFAQPLQIAKGEAIDLLLGTEGVAATNPITIFCGNTITAGRFDIVQAIPQDERYSVNGQTGTGRLCLQLSGMEELSFYRYYWLLIAVLWIALSALGAYWWAGAKKGRYNPLVMLCLINTKYTFLLHELVTRDFKAKYKRSALGMAWSFLNPLLTMAVQYLVFSTIFKSDVENYPVYLLTGIVFFSFFTEAVNAGMVSITGNASLIKKVFIPKAIYPLSKVLSSLQNLGLSLIPLFIVALCTGTPVRPALFLLVFDVMCMLCFVLGMVLLLSTLMTFFQDTQFLWSVVSLLWMYLTPIFYTESIIPAQFLTLYHMNPMYHYISFARICIINGISPEPMAYLWCLISGIGVLLIGAAVFGRQQNKFTLYL